MREKKLTTEGRQYVGAHTRQRSQERRGREVRSDKALRYIAVETVYLNIQKPISLMVNKTYSIDQEIADDFKDATPEKKTSKKLEGLMEEYVEEQEDE